MPTIELSVSRERLALVRDGAVAVREAPAVFRIAGPGARDCLQGLLTNDLVAVGDNRLVYGALLTAKGMIVADYWVLRLPDAFLLVTRPEAREPSLELFRRQLPPRLARVTDLTDAWAALQLLGGGAQAALARAQPALAADEPAVVRQSGDLVAARGTATAPFAALVLGPADAIAALEGALRAAGVESGTADDADAARILAGWPRLGAEIEERTLPQEVRYDEIGGVSYTKGCYVGQETVARLHFRGHTNRDLRGLVWEPGAAPSGDELSVGGKPVGAVRSVLASDGLRVGLALVRREVETGALVLAGGATARVVALPFEPDELA
jgi:folate-binding protein YgfZ